MRQMRAGIIMLAAAVLGGCFSLSSERSRTGQLAGQTPLPALSGTDLVQLDAAVLERGAGDDFVNRALWQLADEQAVSLECKPLLDDNGFRVCQVGGLPPAGLQAMLMSPRSNPDPHRTQILPGKTVPIALGPEAPYGWFRVHTDGADRSVELKDVRCWLDVVPTLAEDGRIRLKFTPRVQHGVPTVVFAPQKDPGGTLRWERIEKQPEESFERLAWEVTVSANEFVIVGTRLDRPETLGQTCFLPVADGPRVQRLLVLRSARFAVDQTQSLLQPGPTAPLALRASLQTARGCPD